MLATSRLRIGSAFLLVVSLLSGISAGAAAPLEVYGHLPSMEDIAISPDGSQVACIKTLGDDRLLLVVNLSDMQVIKEVRIGQNKVRSVRWADKNHLMLTTSSYDRVSGFTGSKSEFLYLLTY